MEVYEQNAQSFTKFLDLYLANGNSKESLLKNTSKYIYDGETEETFLNLYLTYHSRLAPIDRDLAK